MTTHFFDLLNSADKLWVSIFIAKYGDFRIWNISCLQKASWLYKSLCQIAATLKPNLWINMSNPRDINLLGDPWCLDLPISYKPTYVNMSLPIESLSFQDFINGQTFNIEAI